MGLDAWLQAHAEPRPPRTPSLIGACAGSAHGRVPLCTSHRERRRHRHETGMKGTIYEGLDAWAAVQPPRLTGFQFSLVSLPERLRHELLFALVERDKQRPTLSPVAMRLMVRGLAGVSSVAELTDKKLGDLGYLDRNCEAHWNDVVRLVRGAFDLFRGVDPLDRPVWELSDLGLRSRTRFGVRTDPLASSRPVHAQRTPTGRPPPPREGGLLINPQPEGRLRVHSPTHSPRSASSSSTEGNHTERKDAMCVRDTLDRWYSPSPRRQRCWHLRPLRTRRSRCAST
ncbi:hypothetical protein ACFV80_45940 [Streptomyces sp. NPDC059862]|uniref:hypothetical protein n=1 Tax=Streptomyces sp. NPDC059862 TaxID=3346975 RepID=UPI003659C527